jgi:hypothetical protein
MSWQETFSMRAAPGAFSGITFGRWLRVLRDNDFDIDGRYWPRAALITAGSLTNSALARYENLRFGRQVRATKVQPPLFVLGIWRSGTTHLHNLLARDDRFAYPAFYDVIYPHTFLTTEKTNKRFVAALVPNKRPQDNMHMGVDEPQEDEFALCSLTGRSYLMTLAFPRRSKHYERYLTLRKLPAEEINEWKSALRGFIQKLAFKYRRPLVLKSPGHTARIRFLLEMFPEAKFVHIHRHPFDVFRSAMHSVPKLSPYWTLQQTDYGELEADILRQYKQLIDAYLQDRSLIPRGRLHEISFARLEANPLAEMRGIYEALALPRFGHVERALRSYLDSLASYRRNRFTELRSDLRERITSEWRPWFEEWGYPT